MPLQTQEEADRYSILLTQARILALEERVKKLEEKASTPSWWPAGGEK